ncbi:diguanylate cyclase, partial [Corallococcus sp. CA053C]|uniref:hypothetical protein n=1 Tax=Corallococcus sp. CA053C TaxID=2316732 RepID=UPI000ECB7D63
MSAHVLIVDPLAARRVLSRAALRAAHYVVTPLARASEAVGLALPDRADLVLLALDEGEVAL